MFLSTKVTKTLAIWILLPILHLTAPAFSLVLESVSVPYLQVSGSRVRLGCPFKLEGEQLYSVKWYRGANEFFRYIPADKPRHMQVFDLPGVKVDTAASGARVVELHPVSLESSGSFKCEVSADNPSFFTAFKTGYMQVVEPPKSGPVLSGLLDTYTQGQHINATCSSKSSRPAASLTWYINGEQVHRHQLKQFAPVLEDGDLETSLLGLQFPVTFRHMQQRQITLNCTASIAAVYWDSTAKTVHLSPLRDSRESALESKVVPRGCGQQILPSLLMGYTIILMEVLFAFSNGI